MNLRNSFNVNNGTFDKGYYNGRHNEMNESKRFKTIYLTIENTITRMNMNHITVI